MTSSLGTLYRIHTFGESHGPGVGVVIDGCPAGLVLDVDHIQNWLTRRRPGQSRLSSQRKEKDKFELLSGLYGGKTLGTPIAALVRNTDSRGKDYDQWAQIYRPSHADYTYHAKYGHRTPHGGGRASVRETIGRVIGGSVAAQVLEKELGIQIISWVDSIGSITSKSFSDPPQSHSQVDASLVRCPDPKASVQMIQLIDEVRKEGDSIGGTIGLAVYNVPPGLGEPVFEKLEAELAKACLSISACKGFESGSGKEATKMKGSEHNDPFYTENGQNEQNIPPNVKTRTNHSGGIQGGITNGMPILIRASFKPTATIFKPQESVEESGKNVTLKASGRHDPCVLPRAVPIVEAMVALVLMDSYLMQRARNPEWWLRYAKEPIKTHSF